MSWKPRKKFEPIAIVGLIVTILLHGGVLVGVVLYRRALLAAEKPPPPGSYVVAKLLRLGKPRDPKRMPDKIVPQPETRVEEAVDLTADANDAPAVKKKREVRDAPIGDRLRRSLDRAELLAAGQREIEGEGSPDGVVGGTARDAKEGDPYITRIADMWLRTWSLPSIIPRDEARTLYVQVTVHLERDGRIQSVDFDRPSGNTYFDNSIRAAWQAIRQLPVPPPDRFASVMAHGLSFKLTWKGLE